jgi:hypothetical protein
LIPLAESIEFIQQIRYYQSYKIIDKQKEDMKMYYRKSIAVSTVLAAALLLAGCGVEADFTVDKNGNPDVASYICMPEDEATQYGIDKETLAGLETILYNETTYYKLDSDSLGDDVSDDSNEVWTEDYYNKYDGASFYSFPNKDTAGTETSDTDETSGSGTSLSAIYDFVIYNVQMADDIILTNGTVSADGKTVTFDALDSTLNDTGAYAYTADSDDIIRIRELYESKWSKTKTIHIDTVDTLKSVKVDGEAVKVKTTDSGVSIKLTDGKHKVTVKTANAQKTFTVKVDSTKPTVSVKEKKSSYTKPVTITFSDDGSGIKKATLNGKKIKNETTVKKAGEYTLKVTDKAGNTKTVKFTIK